MKKVALLSMAAAFLLFTGCSSTEPAVDAPQEQAQKVETTQDGGEATPVATEEVSSDMQQVGSESVAVSDTNEDAIMQLQSKFSTIYFDFDKFNIRPDMQSVVSTDAELAKNAPESLKIKLEGNCDEWGSDEYNLALGLKRAKSVKDALVAEGVASEKVTLVSYGESNPVCTEHTKECWAKNRRVDIKVLP
ncbi:MAG: peptidoglycan-associated lipoprotein Pal [Epsilonproteobacteria bacterium]|nr:peptidoglycan-associated lipoprotein Pal [Campylobacterota bacterium]